MPTVRDQLKSHDYRIAEVALLAALKTGQANGQLVVSGGVPVVGTTNTAFTVPDTTYYLGGARRFAPIANNTNVAVAVGATTIANQFLKVLLELNAAGAIVQTVGAIAGTQALAALPAFTAANIAIGWIEVPASFTPGTTVVTAGMLKTVTFDAG